MRRTRLSRIARCLGTAALATTLAACAVAPARIDDPWQPFNRKMFEFNRFADKVVAKPVAKGYVKVTTPKVREHVSDFFTNLRAPITIVNEVLQGRPGPALDTLTAFIINSTAGIAGIFDPASKLDVPAHTTDFGVTLADWGVPSGPYLVLPFFGPSTVRDAFRYPADLFADPLYWYGRDSGLPWYERYAPRAFYLVTVRADLLPFDNLITSAADPYAFVRDAYLQRRLFLNYHGNPPLSAIEQLQGTAPSESRNNEIEELLKQQEQYEKTHGGTPGAGSSAPAPVNPAPATSTPAPASS